MTNKFFPPRKQFSIAHIQTILNPNARVNNS